LTERGCDTIQKGRVNAYTMRTFSAGVLLILLLASSAPLVEADSKGVVSCAPADTSVMPSNWNIDDGACVRIDLGTLSPGDTLSFDVASDVAIDVLMFASSSITVYQNEQNYRLDSVWQTESVFESFTGSGTWHWTAPSDRGDTRWYIVLDNMAHPQDQGGGAQGGSVADVTLDVASVSTPTFGIVDSIVRLETDTYQVLAGPLTLDAGTLVNMFSTTMQGAPDVFLMTENQLDLYEQGGTATTFVSGSEMLLVSNERTMSWTVTEQYQGENLYLVADNRPGPAGGGAGTGFVATTVVVDLTPILNPIISDAENLAEIDVSTDVILDASNTPNHSNQIPSDGFHWDTNGDGIDDTAGMTVTVSWDEPANVSVRLRIVSNDGRSDSVYLNMEVKDMTPPELTLTNSEIIRKDFDDELLLTAGIQDNWGIASVEWLMDDQIEETYNSNDWEDGKTFTFRFDSTYAAGEHTVTLRVTDKQGLISEEFAIIELYDSTPPIVPSKTEEVIVILGETNLFAPEAFDPESTNLQYTWDFDVEFDLDGDGDTTNDAESSGIQIYRDFPQKGTYEVVCTITNDAGVYSQITYYVTVVSDDDDPAFGLDPLLLVGLVLLVIVLIVGLIGFISWKRTTNERLAVLLAEQAAADEEKPKELTIEEQKAMYGGGSAISQPSTVESASPFGQYATGMAGTGDPAATAAAAAAIEDPDIDELISSSTPITSTKASSPAADLLAEFSDDDEVDNLVDVVEYSHDSGAGEVWNPEPETDDMDEELPSPPPPAPAPESVEEELPSPPTPDESDIAEPQDDESEEEESSPPPVSNESEEESEEPATTTSSGDRTVQQNCSDCEQRFEITLPDGHDVVRTACPSCGSIETITLN